MNRFMKGSMAAVLSIALFAVAGCGTTPETKPAAPSTGGAPQQNADGPKIAEIKKRGKLVAGVKNDVPLFGYLDPKDQQVKGFDVDVAKAIAKEIFGDENKIELKQVKSADRIPALQQGDVDVIIATMTINDERKKQIDFSQTYYLAGMGLTVKKGGGVTKIEDLAGKKVAAVKGANSGPNMERLAKEKNFQGMTVDLYPTYPEAIAAMKTGRAAAAATDNIIGAGFVAEDPNTIQLLDGLLTDEPYGVGIKKGTDDLLKLVNTVVENGVKNGEFKKLAQKWNVPWELK
jgi:putative glutamine transport system substrate-binding protein